MKILLAAAHDFMDSNRYLIAKIWKDVLHVIECRFREIEKILWSLMPTEEDLKTGHQSPPEAPELSSSRVRASPPAVFVFLYVIQRTLSLSLLRVVEGESNTDPYCNLGIWASLHRG